MAYRLFSDIRTQVEMETDTEGEDFIQPLEMVGFLNSAITVVESEIIKLGLREKYLQGEAYISTVSGTADYDLPSDIIDTKIRKAIYRNGSITYELEPMINEDQYLKEDIYNQYSANEQYQYQIYKKQSDDKWKIRLTPKASATVTDAIRVIYWRSLNRMIDQNDESTLCDVPKVCEEFILSFVRRKIYKKEKNLGLQIEGSELDSMLQLMRDTLSGQIADPNIDKAEMDLTIYQEMI